jgi:hypothetical protein
LRPGQAGAYPAIPVTPWQYVDGIERRLSGELPSGPRAKALQRPGAAARNMSLAESTVFLRAA